MTDFLARREEEEEDRPKVEAASCVLETVLERLIDVDDLPAPPVGANASADVAHPARITTSERAAVVKRAMMRSYQHTFNTLLLVDPLLLYDYVL